MFVWGWLPIYVTGWLSIFVCLVVTFRPRFHIDYLAPSATALLKRSTMVQMFSPINMLNYLPPLLALCVLKHVRTRIIILIGRKSNHKIKIAGTGQLAVGIRPLGCKYTFLSFTKMLTALRTCMGQGVKRRVRE